MVTTAVLRRWVSAARVTGPQPHVGKVRVHRPSSRTSDDADDRRPRPGAGTSIIPAARRPVRPLGLLTRGRSLFRRCDWRPGWRHRRDRRDDVRVEVERDANGGVAEPLGVPSDPPLPSAPTSRRCDGDRGGGCGTSSERTMRSNSFENDVGLTGRPSSSRITRSTSEPHSGPTAIRSSR